MRHRKGHPDGWQPWLAVLVPVGATAVGVVLLVMVARCAGGA